MKNFTMMAVMLLFCLTVSAQRYTAANYGDTITNTSATSYAVPVALSDLCYGAFGVYVDHITGSSDSTYVYVQGSIDNSNWTTLGSTAATTSGTITITSPASTSFVIGKVYQTDGAVLWTPTTALTLPYYRFYVSHMATGTIRVKAWMYKKK